MSSKEVEVWLHTGCQRLPHRCPRRSRNYLVLALTTEIVVPYLATGSALAALLSAPKP